MTYSKMMLRAVALELQKAVSYTCAGFANDDPAFAWISAGDGEVQVSEDGESWWLKWDSTHAVSDERELTPPDTDDYAELAKWMKDEAQAAWDRAAEQQAESRYGGDGTFADND